MNQEIKDAFDELFSAFERFKISLTKARSEHDIELVAQRFDFIMDHFLRYIRLFLKSRSYNCDFPHDCIKAAAKFGIIVGESIFLEMLDDKYRLSKITSQKIPEEIYQRIKIRYSIILGRTLEKINNSYNNKADKG